MTVHAQPPDLRTCALCLTAKPLQRSHIIPNALFRRIKKTQNSGQLIRFDDSAESPVIYSQDSWHEQLMCATCEQLVGRYEKYGLSLLQLEDGESAREHQAGVTFRNHDYDRFKLFLTSLLWRASVSSQPYFQKVKLPPVYQDGARLSVLRGKAFGPLHLGCRLQRLCDRTPEGFTPQCLQQFITSPVPRLDQHSRFYSVVFVMAGFVLEYFVPAIPKRLAEARGTHQRSSTWFVPYKSIFDIPELEQLLIAGYGKYERGLDRTH